MSNSALCVARRFGTNQNCEMRIARSPVTSSLVPPADGSGAAVADSELHGLGYFLAVVHHGSLSRAAAALSTTQSTVSRQIAGLESRCGGRLFHRNGRGMVPTDLGERLLPRVRTLLRDVDDLFAEARGHATEIGGQVRVGLLPTVASALARRLHQEVRARYPKVSLRFLEGYSGQLEEWLAGDKADVAVLFHYGKGKPADQDMLARVDACLIGVSGDALTASPTVPFSALGAIPLILPTAPNPLRALLEQVFRRRGMTLNAAGEANTMQVQLELVAGGGCYTITPYFAAARQVRAGQLQASLITHPMIERALTLALSTQRSPSQAVREVARLVRQILQEMEASDTWMRRRER